MGNQYGDIPRGIYLVRGENVALCGEIVSHSLLAAWSIVQLGSLRIRPSILKEAEGRRVWYMM